MEYNQTSPTFQQLSSSKCHNGLLNKYSHQSGVTNCEMRFNVFIPPAAISSSESQFPVLFFLSGLTCTEDNFMQKAGGALRAAAQNNIFIVTPDTSPRGCNIDGEADSWDLGVGAGFYVDATVPKWANNYRMYTYILKELPEVLRDNFATMDLKTCSIFGHSMGGHGALTIFLKNSEMFKSVSAFAPICNPKQCPWGQKAFAAYLGSDQSAWSKYDATELARQYAGRAAEILIDQGSSDKFLMDGQLLPDNFVMTAKENGKLKVNYRLQEGYDHGYYFITTFIEEHINWHAQKLNASQIGK